MLHTIIINHSDTHSTPNSTCANCRNASDKETTIDMDMQKNGIIISSVGILNISGCIGVISSFDSHHLIRAVQVLFLYKFVVLKESRPTTCI